jgi:hypothetical protein
MQINGLSTRSLSSGTKMTCLSAILIVEGFGILEMERSDDRTVVDHFPNFGYICRRRPPIYD